MRMAPDNNTPRDDAHHRTDQQPNAHAQHGQQIACAVRRGISPITRRILAINVLALGILVAGVLYLGEYRDSLIDSEITNLRAQAEMFAAALGEGAVGGHTPIDQEMVRDTANRIVLRMVESTNTRARLFSASGTLVADSRKLVRAGREVEVEILPPPDETPGLLRAAFKVYDRLLKRFPGQFHPPPYIERPRQHARHYEEVMRAFSGETTTMVRSHERDYLMLSAAVPVQRYKQVLGTLMVSKTSHDIDQALYDVRVNIVQMFFVALSITTLLSIYLAGTIARPITRLAAAAERVRHSLNRQDRLPAFKSRNDEIGDLAIALRDMTDALWGRMDAIERFAADVSHEIKNPLTSLKSAVETAARIKDPEQQKKLLSIIQEDVERLDRLITDISDASRIDAELSRTELASIDIGRMLETLMDVHVSTATSDAPSIKIETDGRKDYTVPGMGDRLGQVFRNLIGNAVTFSPPNGAITISLNHEKAGRHQDILVIAISDEGPGIQPGKEEAIFERFYTERPQGEKFGTHSGLGLSISKQIVHAHGGVIEAENRYNTGGDIIGARFIVTLPASAT